MEYAHGSIKKYRDNLIYICLVLTFMNHFWLIQACNRTKSIFTLISIFKAHRSKCHFQLIISASRQTGHDFSTRFIKRFSCGQSDFFFFINYFSWYMKYFFFSLAFFIPMMCRLITFFQEYKYRQKRWSLKYRSKSFFMTKEW